MELLFLGTGAPDWQKATGFKRRYASLLLDGTLLIDPNAMIPQAMQDCGVDRTRITAVLVTHTHGDHFCPESISCLAPVTVYGDDACSALCPERFTPLTCGVPIRIGSFTVTAVPANHMAGDTAETALHYVIEKDGQTLFYGNDGAWIMSKAFTFMNQHRFDCMILDCTVNGSGGNAPDGSTTFFANFDQDGVSVIETTSHNCVAMATALRELFLSIGMADHKTLFIANHLAWHGFPDMETACAVLEPRGFLVPYDGLALRLFSEQNGQ
ncbi:MAG: hypothetical protein GX173_04795 [Ruminococcaceae bacterium]|nr:hypothetical protein [Oscillospiraceae bacterium]